MNHEFHNLMKLQTNWALFYVYLKHIHVGDQYIHRNSKSHYKSQKGSFTLYVVPGKATQLLSTI